MMPLVPYGSLGLNERPMLLLWVECGTLVFLLWWRNGRRGALKMRYL